MSEIVQTLVEMGFDQAKAEVAVEKTGGRDVQEAMDWLLSHPDFEPSPSTSTTELKEETANNDENTSVTESSGEAASAEAKSLKCDECGKLFKNHLEVEFHAAKSGHSSFSESTEEKKPLTEEEKREQKARLEKLMQQKRKEREEKERVDALEREKNRIRSGKELTEAKRKQQEIEIKKMYEQRKREKQEELLAKQRIREQIEQDKLARKAKFNPTETAANASISTPAPPPPPQTPVASSTSTSSNKSYTEAKLQIRLTNGTALTQTFGAKEPLSAVRLFVEMNRTDNPGPFSLMTSFPRKTFNLEDYDKPLDVLGLAPSAVIIVTKS